MKEKKYPDENDNNKIYIIFHLYFIIVFIIIFIIKYHLNFLFLFYFCNIDNYLEDILYENKNYIYYKH